MKNIINSLKEGWESNVEFIFEGAENADADTREAVRWCYYLGARVALSLIMANHGHAPVLWTMRLKDAQQFIDQLFGVVSRLRLEVIEVIPPADGAGW
jgi:hypothetical protein